MKTGIYLLLCFCFLLLQQFAISQNSKGITPLPEENKPGKISRAVIIGISEYDNQPKLEYAHKDALSIYDYLISPAGGNVDSSKIVLLLNRKATAGKIWEALQELVDETNPGETVLIYFSGHGDLENKTIRQNGFLLASDAPTTCYFVGGTIGLNYLHDFLETLATKNKATVIMITDACKSGKLSGGLEGVKNTTAALTEQWSNIIKILSSQAGEISLEGQEWGNGEGVFTYYLLRGLKGFADRNNDKAITLSELFSYLNDHVPHDTKFAQNPYVVGNLRYNIAYVDSTTYTQLQKNESPGVINLAYGSKGVEEELKNKLDPEIYSSYSDFQECIQQNNLIYSYFKEDSKNAYSIYNQIKDIPNAELILPRMKRQLLAALQDKSQQVINTWFIGQDKPDSISIYDLYDEAEAAFFLVDSTYILYDYIKGRYLLMKALTTSDTSKAMKLFRECTFFESDATFYAYFMLGYKSFQIREFTKAIDYFTEATNKAPGFFLSLIWASRCYSELFSFEKAKQALLLVLSNIEEKYGKDNRLYSISLNNLALVHQSMGNYTAAEPLYKEALEIQKKVSGESHPDYAASLNNLGSLYVAMGNYLAAEPLYKQALEIKKKVLGEFHPDYVASLNNLASLYVDIDNYSIAESLYKEALEIQKEVLGVSHLDYATLLSNLANLYVEISNYTGTEHLYKEALEIQKKVLGEFHPDYATSLTNLGVLYSKMRDYAATESLYKQALDIRKKVLGESHPDYANSLNNLAVLYQVMGNYKAAEPLYKQALDIRKKVLGESHSDYANSLNNLAWLYQNMGNFTEAEPLYKQALEIRKKVLGESHPDYATSLNNLAILNQVMGNYIAAEPLYKQAMEIRRKILGESHPKFVKSLYYLASLYQDMGNYMEAESLYKEVLEIRKKVLGEFHPDYATSLSDLALFYDNMGNYSTAESLFKKALEIDQNALGVNHPDYAIVLYNLANLYCDMGNYTLAESLYKQVIQIDKKFYGVGHKEIASDMSSLASLYKDLGKYSTAILYYDSSLLIDTTDVESIYWRGKCKYFFGDTLGAKRDCRIYIAKSKNSLRKCFCQFYCGQKTEATEQMEEIEKEDPTTSNKCSLSAMYALNERNADALNWLEDALEQGYKEKQYILRDPSMKSIRDLPEFKNLMEKYFGSSK